MKFSCLNELIKSCYTRFYQITAGEARFNIALVMEEYQYIDLLLEKVNQSRECQDLTENESCYLTWQIHELDMQIQNVIDNLAIIGITNDF